jgi:hypothetical protein
VEDSYQPAPSNKSHNSSDSNHPTAIAKPVATAAILDSISYDQSPVHKTLETPELLEQILSFVPSLDLCHARRTSQTFRNVIDHSLVLQKNLFLRPHARIPSTIPCSHLIPQWNGAPDFANCILLDQHDLEVAHNPELHPMTIMGDDPVLRPSPHFHPILILDKMPQNLKSDFEIILNILYLATDPFDGLPAFARAFCSLKKLTQTFDNVSGVSKDSPLHKMFITNPPIKKVDFTIRIPFWDDWEDWVDWEYVEKVCDPNGIMGNHSLTCETGITFAQIFEYTEEAVRGQHRRILPDPLPEIDYHRVRYPRHGPQCDY